MVATSLIKTDGRTGQLLPENLHRFREADARVDNVMNQIRQIVG